MKHTFEPRVGERCVLNSGGPVMTVAELIADGRVMTRWFNEAKDECDIAVLRPAALTFLDRTN